MAGFSLIQEYPELNTAGSLVGFFGDKRSILFASRPITFSNAAAQLGVPEVMQFYPIADPQSGLRMVGVMWQEPGTGDVYVTVAMLFGISAGCQGGTPGSITDNAGLRIVAS